MKNIVRTLLSMSALILCSQSVSAMMVDTSVQEEKAAVQQKELNNQLLVAAQEGKVTHLQSLIAANADVNYQDAKGSTPLRQAAFFGHNECVKALLRAGANVDVRDTYGSTALIYTHCSGRKRDNCNEILTTLIDAKADVDAQDNRGYTALMNSVKAQCIDCATALMRANANTKLRNNDGKTACELAQSFTHGFEKAFSKAEFTINAKNGNRDSALLLAAYEGRTKDLPTLIEAKADINAQAISGDTPLLLATREGHIDFVKALLKEGADFEIKNNSLKTPLMVVAQKGHVECLKDLIIAGANIDEIYDGIIYDGRTPLMAAAQKGHTACVIVLIDAEAADTNHCGESALMVAAENDQLECLTALIEAGVDVNKKSFEGTTALIQAARFGSLECLRALIDAKANLEAQDDDGSTALITAIRNRSLACVKALCKAKAKVNDKGKDGKTPLMHAAEHNHTKILKALIEAKADLKAQNNDRKTALNLAAEKGYFECVKILLEAGLFMRQRDKLYYSDFFEAVRNNNEDLIKAFIKFGYAMYQPNRNRLKASREHFIALIQGMTYSQNGYLPPYVQLQILLSAPKPRGYLVDTLLGQLCSNDRYLVTRTQEANEEFLTQEHLEDTTKEFHIKKLDTGNPIECIFFKHAKRAAIEYILQELKKDCDEITQYTNPVLSEAMKDLLNPDTLETTFKSLIEQGINERFDELERDAVPLNTTSSTPAPSNIKIKIGQ